MNSFEVWCFNKAEAQRHTTIEPEPIDEEKVDPNSIVMTSSKKTHKRLIRDLEEVRRIFNMYDTDQSGSIEPAEFIPLLSKLLKQPQSEMDKAVVWSCWDSIDEDGSGQINFEEFEKWYCQTFGIDTHDYTDFFHDGLVPEDQKDIRKIARDLGLDNVQIEELWRKFKHLDEDGSGTLEYQEFKKLLLQHIAPGQKNPQVSDKVLNAFWNDIDEDKDGKVTFGEFASWYKKCFTGDGEGFPLETFYDGLGRMHRAHLVDRVGGIVRSPTRAYWRGDFGKASGKVVEPEEKVERLA